MEYLRQNVAHIAAWLPLLSILAALAGAVWFIGSRRRGRRGNFALFLTLNALIALIVMFGPMSPLFVSARKLDSWRAGKAPAVGFRDVVTGAERHLDAFRGQVVVVNIWATWCPPCRQEMPVLNRLQKTYASRGLVVVTLTDETPDRVRRFLQSHARDTVNGTTTFEWLQVQKFRPFTFVIDRQGIVREYFFGSQEYAAFEKTIRPYL